jgi:flavin reductase (DIM6/NTAB) family NADH-FMN oxidoreductase RutF
VTTVDGLAGARVGAAPFDDREFRTTLGLFATGVTVVTAAANEPHGMTANAFASVSKSPPLVLVCVDQAATMHAKIRAARAFGVSVLAACQEDVARHFADRLRPDGLAQFDRVAWAPGRCTGAPLLSGALAWLECRLVEAYRSGDHSIFVGSVVELERGADDGALVFFGGKFRALD